MYRASNIYYVGLLWSSANYIVCSAVNNMNYEHVIHFDVKIE